MNTLVNVARYHLVDRFSLIFLPWAILLFSFLVNLVIAAVTPGDAHYTGGLASIYLYLLVVGVFTMTRSLPFGLMLGVSRRAYYLGTTLLVLALGLSYGLALTVLQAIERATNGWGVTAHFFRVPWIMDGPWYLTWLASFVLLVLNFLYGMWYGLVYRRWNLPGLIAFIAAQILVVLGIIVVLALSNGWTATGHFFITLTVPALIGLLALFAAVMGVGGFSTLRRVTI